LKKHLKESTDLLGSNSRDFEEEGVITALGVYLDVRRTRICVGKGCCWEEVESVWGKKDLEKL
jgi:hypothetical protein